ncbi:oxygenase MpaB family protein [Streptomyces sparsogenes]|uniref:oxygenase MpaB family protein n=1 Tax=Streptomyces sparsogenes TaxID=67365 RepID=UPI00384D3ACF
MVEGECPIDSDPVKSSEEKAQLTYRRLALVDFPEDLRLGLNLAFYRTFGVPTIARVLVGTGKMTRSPRARAKATGELMYTLIEHGLDSSAGRDAIVALNRLHSGLPVGEEEFVYVLAAFCVAPVRWIDRHSWRTTTAEEKNASYGFYAGLAQRMHINLLPRSYSELASWMDKFEEQHFAVTGEGQALMDATRGLLAARFPRLVVPLVRFGADALLDERLRAGVGAARPPAVVRGLVAAALRIRVGKMRWRNRTAACRDATMRVPATD